MREVLHYTKRGVVEAPLQPGGKPTYRRTGVSWRSHFDQLVRANYARKREGAGRKTSFRTREYMLETTFLLVNVLRDQLGFKLQKPTNLDHRHAWAWADWINKQYQDGRLQPATLAGYATTVRHLCRWADRAQLVEIFDERLDARAVRRELVADRDKSWDGNAVSVEDAIERAWEVEGWVAMALAAQAGFGLRRREAVQLQPLRDFDLAGGVLYIRTGAKGGRPRVVPVDSPQLLALARSLISFVQRRSLAEARDSEQSQSLAGPQLSLLQALRRYSRVLTSLGYTRAEAGVTGHGLRAGYVCARLLELGIMPVVRGGDGRHADTHTDEIAHSLVSEAVGHSRRSVLGAYAGSPHTIERVRAAQELRERGWLLAGTDAATVKENVRRRDAFIEDPQAFARWIASQAQSNTHGDNHAV